MTKDLKNRIFLGGGGDGGEVRIFRAHGLQEAVVRSRVPVQEAQRT
jgi:hypothetical protein